MYLNLLIALMVSIIAFVVLFALREEFKKQKSNHDTEITKKITNVFRFTTIGIGVTIILAMIAGLNPTSEDDISSWMTLVISTGIGIGIAISVGIYSTHSQKNTEDLIKEIHGYVEQQKRKEKLVQADYARNLLFLINWSRMKVHGMNVQIKLLREILQQPFSSKRIGQEQERREIFKKYVIELKNIMSENKITPEIILEIFDENAQLLFLKMWKMFSSAESMMYFGEDFYESLMTHFIDEGVQASEELHSILIEHIPDIQKKGFAIHSVEAS